MQFWGWDPFGVVRPGCSSAGGIPQEGSLVWSILVQTLMSHRRFYMKSANNLPGWGTLVLLTGLNVS